MSRTQSFTRFALGSGFALAGSAAALAVDLQVTGLSPQRHTGSALINTAISITFDRAVNPASINNNTFRVFGMETGPVAGSFSFSNGNATVTFTPSRRLFWGDVISVTLARSIAAADATGTLRSAGYQYQFMTHVKPSLGTFTEVQEWSVDQPGEFNRIYGGQAADANNDGWVDVTLVCENSNDLRFYENRADGSGLFEPLQGRISPMGPVPSPNVASDFNNDGLLDIATGNFGGDISIAFGNGAGIFGNRVDISAGSARGIVSYDADGDGDYDLACSVPGDNKIFLMLNNGSGGFSAPTLIEGGSNGEYGLCAADMNNDGIMDLVVGHEAGQTIQVLRGNGGASYTGTGLRNAGGACWVIVCGDVNGDGNIDVNSANSGAGNASILLGNGDGTLQNRVTYSSSAHTPATDLADIDGDGDLDMLISSFGAGLWRLYRNNGAGAFTFVQDFPAASNPACAIFLDADRDGDMDMIQLDEIADFATLFHNNNRVVVGDMNCDGFVTVGDIAAFVIALTTPEDFLINFPSCEIENADTNGDGFVTVGDIAGFVSLLTGG